MNDKTREQIEAMKKPTFGIEIEGNNITREKAARTAARYFETDRYEYTAGRNGYDAWSAWDAQGREWKFQKDVSITGPESQKCEMVSPILHYEDMELLQGVVRALRKAGMKSDYTRMAGVHVHISGEGHTPQTIRNLVNIELTATELTVTAERLTPSFWKGSIERSPERWRSLKTSGIRHRMRTGIGTPTTIRHDIEFATCTASSTDTTPSNFGFFNSTALTMASRTECMLDRSSHSSSFALPSTSLPRWSEQQALNPSRPRTKSTQCGDGC